MMAGDCLRASIAAVAAVFGGMVMMEFAVVPTSGQQQAPPAAAAAASHADFYKAHVLDTCCMIGMQWSNASGRCSNYPAPVPRVDEDSQSACLSIVEVCCLKQVQLDMCESGKRTALDNQMCAVRDSDAGAEQFRECCKCCQMGVQARRHASCEVPGLGEPCDSKFAECCTGRPSANFTIPAQIDCSLNNPCEQRCVNRNSGPECQCYEGYRLNDDRRTCADIDECADGSFRCAPNQRCTNTGGGYSCLTTDCRPGMVRNPRTGQCENSNACLNGFALNSINRRCEDINECAMGYDDCKVGERCENTNGGFTCRRMHHCGTGYTLDEASQQCVDNDECVLGTHNCGGGFQCQNVQGSFRCVPKHCPMGSRFDSATGECRPIVCRRGMRPNRSGTCVDIDECAEGSDRCHSHQRCINRMGSYHCQSLVSCPPGYEPTSNSGCQDVNECTSGKHRCSADQECVNRQGSYFCQCPRGMRHDSSGRCVDPRRPVPDPRRPVPDPRRPVPDPRRHVPDPRRPVSGDDIDECLTDNLCQHTCRNVQGSYFCSCNRGYQLRDDNRSCEDIDECTQFRGIGGRGGVCGGRCINTPGSYRCECPDGWRLMRDGRSCEDIDECQENMAFCRQQDGLCINTRGSYKCPVVRCPEGFAKTTSSGPQHSIRCKRVETDCPECRRGLLSRSYNFLTFPSNVLVPAPLFSMTGARDPDKTYTWNLHLLSGRPLRAGIPPADIHYFQLAKSLDQAVVSLVTRAEGPQDIELRLDMNITSLDSGFEGVAESRIYLYITDDGNGRQ